MNRIAYLLFCMTLITGFNITCANDTPFAPEEKQEKSNEDPTKHPLDCLKWMIYSSCRKKLEKDEFMTVDGTLYGINTTLRVDNGVTKLHAFYEKTEKGVDLYNKELFLKHCRQVIDGQNGSVEAIFLSKGTEYEGFELSLGKLVTWGAAVVGIYWLGSRKAGIFAPSQNSQSTESAEKK